jgi:hypothetical protein
MSGPTGLGPTYITPSFLRGTKSTLHPIPDGDSGPSCFVSMSSHQHGSRTSCSASFHPWKSHHVTYWVTCLNFMLHPGHFGRDWLSLSSSCQLMLHPYVRETAHCCHVIITLLTWWTGLCGTPTITPYCPRQQLVRSCQSLHLGMAACLRFQGLSLLALRCARFQGPRVQFIIIEDIGLLSMSCHRTLQFTIVLDIPV